MSEQAEALKSRTKDFALRTIRLVRTLTTPDGTILGKQLLRSATGIGANYRAVCRARSQAEFVSRLGIVVEEAEESIYWLELLIEGGLVKPNRLADLLQEAHELLAIFGASQKTARQNRQCNNPKTVNLL